MKNASANWDIKQKVPSDKVRSANVEAHGRASKWKAQMN